MSIFRTFLDSFIFYWNYLLRFRGDHAAYLRFIGVKIGEGCLISASVHNFGTEPWLIEIGDNVSITDGVIFLTHDGSSRLFRKKITGMNPKYGNRFGAIRIGNDCFIGINSIIMPGVTIGSNSIIGAGSVVTNDVPQSSVVAGNPARLICTIDEYIKKYKLKSVSIQAQDREALRRELTKMFWGEER